MMRARTRTLVAVMVVAGLALGALLGVLGTAIVANKDNIARFDQDRADICRVVKNVHINAQFRHKTEVDRLNGQLKLLKDTEVKKENAALLDRIRDQLPLQRQTVEVARRAVVATRVPDSCR